MATPKKTSKAPAKKKTASIGRRCAALIKVLTNRWMAGGCEDQEIVDDIKQINKIKLHEKVEIMGRLFDKLYGYVNQIDPEHGKSLEEMAKSVLVFGSKKEMEASLNEIAAKYE